MMPAERKGGISVKTKKSFALGYSLVFHSILTYFITGAFTTSGMNVWNGAFSAMHGWETTTLLTMATVAGLIGVLGSILFGQLVAKRGARLIITITMTICGIAIMAFGFIPNVFGYLLCMTIFNFAGHGFNNVGSNAVIGNWFPRRKGFILGITTMGLPAASFLFVPILAASIAKVGLQNSFLIIGIIVAILGVLSWFWVRNTPQEVGLLPDNGKFPETAGGPLGQTSNWTVKKLLTNRNAWFVALAYGLLFLVTQGMVSQTVVYLMQNGFEQTKAVPMLSLSAVVGVVGSFIWGVLDDKLGTKKASVIYAIWYVFTFAVMALAKSPAMLVAGVVLLGSSMGGIGNLMPSMIMTVFGVSEFAAVSRITQTLVTIIRSFAFVVMAIGLKLLGNYANTAWILAGLSVVALVLILATKSEVKKEN